MKNNIIMIVPGRQNTDKQAWLSPTSNFSSLGFPFPLTWSDFIASIARTVAKKVYSLFRIRPSSISKSILPIYKSSISPGIEYYCHIWFDASVTYHEYLDKRLRHFIDPDMNSWFQSLFHSALRCLSLSFLYFHISCSHEMSLLPRSPQVKRTTTLVTRSFYCWTR